MSYCRHANAKSTYYATPQKLQTGPAMAGLTGLTPTALYSSHIHTHIYAVESNVCSLVTPLLNS